MTQRGAGPCDHKTTRGARRSRLQCCSRLSGVSEQTPVLGKSRPPLGLQPKLGDGHCLGGLGTTAQRENTAGKEIKPRQGWGARGLRAVPLGWAPTQLRYCRLRFRLCPAPCPPCSAERGGRSLRPPRPCRARSGDSALGSGSCGVCLPNSARFAKTLLRHRSGWGWWACPAGGETELRTLRGSAASSRGPALLSVSCGGTRGTAGALLKEG